MRDEDLLRCPLLQGLDAMHRAQLLGMLNNSCIRERVERCLTEYLRTSIEPGSPNSAGPQMRNPEESRNAWQFGVPMRRSPKE